MTTVRDSLINAFIRECPTLFDAMQATEQSNTSKPSPYHAENSVWTHTFGVMSYIAYSATNPDDKLVLLYTALLHDIGKVSTATFNPKHERNSFHGHEGVSAYLALDILPKLSKHVNLPSDKYLLVFRLIALHGQHIEHSSVSKLLEIFRTADKFGAVRDPLRDIHEQYDIPKYFVPKVATKTCTILCGLPNSGKTTYVATAGFDYIISRDQCIEDMYVEMFGYKDTYNTMYTVVTNSYSISLAEMLQDRIMEARKYSNIAIDMTMMSRKSRRSMMYSLPGFSFSCMLFVRSVADSLATPRTGKTIPESVFQSMMSSFTYPQIQEGFTSVAVKEFT
jgi:hypothetical protein